MTEELVGKVGKVVVRVRSGDRPGEVVVVVDGAPEFYFAQAPEELQIGRMVLVVHDRGDRMVDVVPWDIEAPGWPGRP